MWDESNKGSENSSQKYLNFIDSVRSSEECDDLKRFVEANVVENKNLEKEKDGVVLEVLHLIEQNLGQSDLEKTTDKWTQFINFNQKSGESIRDFVTRFEELVTGLRNVNITLPQKALAVHMITKSNLSESSKENVLTKVNTDEHEKLYTSLTKAMRELKTLSTSESNATTTFFGNHRNERGRTGSYNSYRRATERNPSQS